MNTYLLLFFVATFGSLLLTPLVGRVCARYGWMDKPRDERRVHKRPVPRLGGVAIFGAMLVALAALPFINNHLTRGLAASRHQLLAVVLPAALALALGVYDDFRGTNARFKFVAQGLVGLLFYALGGRIESLSIPLVGTVALPPVLGCALTLLWVIAITNAFNLIDGMDGLATGTALFASLVVLGVSVTLGHPVVAVLVVALCGALIGFLPYNFNPASIFLGDSGSLFIGFTLAALSVLGAQKASTAVAVVIPLVAFGLPVFDTGFALVRRFIGGRPLFDGDREHIHHKLLERGWSQRRVVLVLYGVCALFGLTALCFVNDGSMRVAGLVLLVTGVASVFVVGSLRYHEVDEVRAGMRRNFSERRLRVANNVRVRRAAREMSQATTLDGIFSALRELLEVGEFVYANALLGRREAAERNQLVLAGEQRAGSAREAVMRGGMIDWSWERGDISAEEIIGSGQFWTLRLPLTVHETDWGYLNLYREIGGDALLLDINYLCNFFQSELACAAERVLGANVTEGADAPPLTLTASVAQTP